jgi:TonB family protein
VPSQPLANHFFNHSLLKQRIIMLHKNKSQRIALIKYGLSAPLFILMLILSSATVNASKIITRINKKTAQVLLAPAVPVEVTSKVDVPVVDKTKPAATPAKTTMTDNKPVQGTVTTTQTDTTNNNNQVFSAVEQEPTFPGGQTGFYQFLAENLKYPESMRKNNITGTVIAQFVVEKDGSLSGIQILRAPNADAGNEAARVLALSPKWNPGLQNGWKVRVQYTVPIKFALDGQTQGENAEVVPIHTSSDSSKVSVIVIDKGIQVNKPLYVLNGKIIKADDFKTVIKPADIYSIVVLKDKLATDKYGTAGANGVILITTKAANDKQ